MNNEKTALFLDLYKTLEESIREQHPNLPRNDSPVVWAIRNSKRLRKMRDELDYCREVRNLLSHNARVNGEYAVIPSGAMIESLKNTLHKIKNPVRAWDICVKTQDVRCAKMNDPVRPVMEEMASKSFTHIPIVEDGRVIEVFSENTLLSYLLEEELASVDNGDTFNKFKNLLPIGAHSPEIFVFIEKEALASDIAEMFNESVLKGERIGMAFVTEGRSPNNRLLGIITAWDTAKFI